MAKKIFKKCLIKAGSTVAVAMAMASAITMQVNAAEVDETLPVDIPPVEEGTETNGVMTNEVLEPAEANETISQANADTAAENDETAESNQQVEQNNDAAAESNESNSGGELVDPGLELPVAPEVPDTEGMGAEDYNEAIGDYNEGVDDYNEAVNDYNEGVDDYNSAADDYDQQAQEQYEEDQAAYDEAKAEHEEAEKQYEEAEKQYEEDSQAYQDYLNAMAQYEQAKETYDQELAQYEQDQTQYEEDSQAYQNYLDALAKYEEEKRLYEEELAQYEQDQAQYEVDSAEYKAYEEAKAAYDAAYQAYQNQMAQYEKDYAQYEADSQAYQDYLDAKAQYEQAKQEYDKVVDAYEAEDAIYDEVTEYNQQVEVKNEDIEDKNAALEDDLHSESVDNIDGVGEINDGVVIDEEVVSVLNGYDELAEQQSALQAEAAALENHAGKNADLGSEAYAEYLTAVEAYNEKVNAFNEAVDDYNAAVEAYNAAVDEYNENRDPVTDSSTGSSTDTGTADWGNIQIGDRTTFNHIDVKYAAAAAKDVTINADGSKTYSDSVADYTVVGVYTSEEAAKDDPDSYGVTYVNNANSDPGTQSLEKQNTEFKGHGTKLDPDDGKISFYMTLKDEAGKTHGITVNLDDTDVYPEGTYYAGEDKGQLSKFLDKDGQALPTVTIDGVVYYDISGQSVFVISALTCNGSRYQGGNVTTDGLDLVLNVQTLIQIHKSDNAKKVSYRGYELGKTAQATAPEAPGEFAETEPDPMDPPEAPEMPTFDMDEPDPMDPPEAPEMPTFDMDEPDPMDPPEAPEMPTFNMDEPDPVDKPGNPPVGPGAFDQTPPEAPVPAVRLDHVEQLQKLNEKVIVVIAEPDPIDPQPVDPQPVDPQPVDPQPEGPAPMPALLNDPGFPINELDGEIEIPDEEVPLAAAPKTGDLSMLWAAISGLSLGGMMFVNKKRDDEE